LCAIVVLAVLGGPVRAAAQQDSGDPLQPGLAARLSGSSGAGAVAMENKRMQLPKAVRAFYEARDYAPAWHADGRFRPAMRTLLDVVRSASAHGLPPRLYHAAFMERLVRSPEAQYDTARRVDIELLLTDAMLSLANDMLRGRARRVDLKDTSFDAAEDINADEVAAAALASGDLAGLTNRVAPEAAAYRRLREALARLRERAADAPALDLPESTLHPGDAGAGVAALRRRLVLLGDLPAPAGDPGGVMDAPLVDAVKRFQARHGLEVDGVVGRDTRAALETPLAKRVKQLELSLERWRWLPRDPGGRYMIVNIGGQELDVIENDQATLEMRVIVGKPYQRTPSFASRVETVVLNPYWNVPHSIAVNEILPKLREDPSYLARENMEVLRREVGSGTSVNSSSIDWDQVPARNFSYRFRQRPGPGNALGAIKFLMPNPYSVYLHDTPAKSLFARSRRNFSHGCVRLELPLELAEVLLHDEPGWAMERVEKTLETEQNYRIRLTHPMPVYLVYFTAWTDNDGMIHFRDDVYRRDARLQAALEHLNH